MDDPDATYFCLGVLLYLTLYNALYLVDLIVKVIAECMIGAKENLDENLLASFHNRSLVIFNSFAYWI